MRRHIAGSSRRTAATSPWRCRPRCCRRIQRSTGVSPLGDSVSRSRSRIT